MPSAATSTPNSTTGTAVQTNPRQRWLGLLARAAVDDLRTRAAALGPLPPHILLRGPEPGLVMLRGRAGATGAPFNLGEMTVTRCSVRLGSGAIGHAYIAGRDREQARLAAVLDALLQSAPLLKDVDDWPARIEAAVLAPLEAAERAKRETRTRKAAATKVEFFTMVRSEHGGRD